MVSNKNTKSKTKSKAKEDPTYNLVQIILGIIFIILFIYLFNNLVKGCQDNKNNKTNNKADSFEDFVNDTKNLIRNEQMYNMDNYEYSNELNEGFRLYNNVKNSNKENNQEKHQKYYNNKEIHYLYWTGGYDSTFRLCEMLIDEGKRVQPYYVTLLLDNDCQTEESCNKLWLRRNRKEEKQAINEIINKIKTKFPSIADNLLPVIYIDNPIQDNKFNYEYDILFNSVNLWPRKRKKHQYLFLSKFAFYHKRDIDIGVLGIHEKSKFAKFLKKNLVKTEDNFILKNKKHPLGYLRFPLYGRTKEDLLYKSQINNYDDILKISWSCWFPKDGKPCTKCPMCKERVVNHPSS